MSVSVPSRRGGQRRRVLPALAILALAVLVVAVGAVFVPGPSADGATTFTFAIFGDVNNSASDTPAPVFASVLNGIKASGATLALSSGDALNDVADTSVTTALGRWSKFMGVEKPKLDAYMPVWRTAGDNDRLDVSARLSAWQQTFPTYPTSPDTSRRWYSRDLGGAHVVFLNTAYASHVGWMGYVSETSTSNSTEAKWLVSDLKAATASGPRTVVVVTHYPLINGKTTKPYAGTKASEATALRGLFAKYGVDMVVTGDTHVYRRTMVSVNSGGVTRKVPYLQIPPAASAPRTFGTSPIPSLGSAEAGWAPGSSYRGFIKLAYAATTRVLTLSVSKVAVSGGAVSSAEDRKANANALGGSFADVPSGCALGAAN